MLARAFGIFCCSCLIWYHIPRSSLYTYHIVWDRSWTSCGWVPGIIIIRYSFFVFKSQTGNSRIAVYVDVRSCFWHLLLFALIRITYLAARGMHIISSSRIKPEHRVLLYTLMFARAFGIFCCLCLISHHIPVSYTHLTLPTTPYV